MKTGLERRRGRDGQETGQGRGWGGKSGGAPKRRDTGAGGVLTPGWGVLRLSLRDAAPGGMFCGDFVTFEDRTA